MSAVSLPNTAGCSSVMTSPFAHAIRRVIVGHHAAVVDEAVLEQELDRMRAQVPRRRAITARVAAGELADRLVRAHELFFLLVAGEARRRTVRPAVMADLVARIGDAPAGVRIGLQRMPRDVPRARYRVALESSSRRGTPTCGPNSPREIGLGEVMPRAIQPEIASKSNVRQTMDRPVTWLCGRLSPGADYNTAEAI